MTEMVGGDDFFYVKSHLPKVRSENIHSDVGYTPCPR